MIPFLIILTLLWTAWLAFMLLAPKKWSSIVQKENDFWVNRKIIKPALAAKCINLETGIFLKIIAGLGLVTFLALIFQLNNINGANQRFEPIAITSDNSVDVNSAQAHP